MHASHLGSCPGRYKIKSESGWKRAVLTSNAIGSERAREALPFASTLPREVQALVTRIYDSAQSHIFSLIGDKKITDNEIESAEAILMQINQIIRAGSANSDRLPALSAEYFAIFGRKSVTIRDAPMLEREQELCENLKDLLGVNEVLGGTQDVDTKFRALRAEVKHLPAEHEEYAKVVDLVGDSKIKIKNIYQGAHH